MARYIQIEPDGTRTEVKYSVHHDGPVSHRLTLLKRVKHLAYQLDLRPGNHFLAMKLKQAWNKLSVFDSVQKKVSSRRSHEIQNPAGGNEHSHSLQDQPHRDKEHRRSGWNRGKSASDSAIGLGLPANTPGQPSTPALEALFGYQYPLELINIGLPSRG